MSDVMIDARDLTKQYGPVTAVKNATFQVNRGEVVGFLGPNGAGKTTTMKILTCFIAPSGGTARVAGADIFEDPISVREAIGYLPESTPLYTEMLVLEYLEFVGKMRELRGAGLQARLRRVVEETSLGDVIGKSIGELSKGYRQRVGLAQALIHEPPVLILDEPMSGLDPNQASEIRQLIREIGRERTVILSTHNLAEVQVTCGRVLIIANGQLVADDTPEELAARAGKPRFVATIRKDGLSESAIRDAFSEIIDAQSVKQKTDAAAGEVVVEIVPKGNQDLRANIFHAAVSANIVLLGLEQRGENLEDIFRQLTTGNSGVPS
ncbi:MAG TPA: ATP-binding cassette domain-containing protein [Polyangiales bacterium]|jgi:ABC-2 type transport system ATP-binding protein|nr:ATP-binding cassette domain-containing protein [Polyangiales bacterium]